MNNASTAFRYLYFFGLAVVLVGLPLGKFFMSVGQFILAGAWVLETILRSAKHGLPHSTALGGKLKRLWGNKAAVLLCGVYVLHAVGLLWTENYEYALHDLRIKAPLFILPFILGSIEPLPRKMFKLLVGSFVLAVIISTIVSTLVLMGTVEREINDVREISRFISHIRFSLLICVSIFLLFYFCITERQKKLQTIVCIGLATWLLAFLFILRSPTGIAVLAIVGTITLAYYTLRSKRIWVRVASVTVILLSLGITAYVAHGIAHPFLQQEDIDVYELPQQTPRGEDYYHRTDYPLLENGHRVWHFVAWNELETEWEKRSDIDFRGQHNGGGDLSVVLIRYLASKGLTKDADGIQALSQADIEAVESGIANYKFLEPDISTRIYQVFWELHSYSIGSNPEGNSVTMRFEFWKAAMHIFKEHPLIGVGTGDVKDAFNTYYKQSSSELSKDYWLRAHNQYLSMLVTFGSIGFLLFVIALFYPIFFESSTRFFPFVAFFAIAAISMLTEDTLETQAGVTFFAALYSWLLFVGNPKE